MIRLPQRSVTRFFIPLIDVLTLLFCIFLVLPLATGTEDQSAAAGPAHGKEPPADADLERLRKELERLRQEKGKPLPERLWVRVLEIDPQTGKLYYRDRGPRGEVTVEIRDEADARALIDADRREAGQRQLYYVILYPRTRSKYPSEGQVDQYQRWFAGVALGFEVPGAGPVKGKPS